MSKKLDSLLTVVLAIAALAVSSAYAYRTFSPVALSAQNAASVVRMDSWGNALQAGVEVAGDSEALATLVVFGDFQCPACRAFHRTTLAKALAKYPHELRVLQLHFPLPYHEEALPAARATECIGRGSVLREWMDLLYEKQDSLGRIGYGELARRVGISDTGAIVRCAQDTLSNKAIDSAIALGKSIHLRGTPTVVIDGWVLPQPPTLAQIDSVIASHRR